MDKGATEVSVKVSRDVENHTNDGVFGKTYGTAPLWHFAQRTPRTQAGKDINKLAKMTTSKANTLEALHDLSNTIIVALPYGHADTFAGTTAEKALIAGGGVFLDHAQIFVSAARVAGIPARHISGYLMMNDRINQDASNAWA